MPRDRDHRANYSSSHFLTLSHSLTLSLSLSLDLSLSLSLSLPNATTQSSPAPQVPHPKLRPMLCDGVGRGANPVSTVLPLSIRGSRYSSKEFGMAHRYI